MHLRIFADLILTAMVGPVVLSAQEAPDCQVRLDRSKTVRVEQGSGQVRQYVSQGVFSCIGLPGTSGAGLVLWNGRSDSVARYVSRGQIEFIDAVEFSDSTAELTADRATYYERDDRLEAEGHVRLVNLITGTVLEGPRLTYLRAVEGVRDTAELRATQRPRVEYFTESDSSEPYLIVADRVKLKGNATWAQSNVTIDRSDFAARGDSAWLDLDLGRGLIVGNAETSGRDSLGYVMRGNQIGFGLVDDKLDWVQAQGDAEATGADWEIVGDTLAFTVSDDKIQTGAAWGGANQPQALSEIYSIVADSLAVDMPDQQLSEVRGYGRAVATTSPDSVDAEPDWIAGDTVTARFDSTNTGSRSLVALTAAGHAQAFYKIYDEADSSAAPAINYARGLKIIALFKGESLERVDVIGEADGVYLEPRRIPPR